MDSIENIKKIIQFVKDWGIFTEEVNDTLGSLNDYKPHIYMCWHSQKEYSLIGAFSLYYNYKITHKFSFGRFINGIWHYPIPLEEALKWFRPEDRELILFNLDLFT